MFGGNAPLPNPGMRMWLTMSQYAHSVAIPHRVCSGGGRPKLFSVLPVTSALPAVQKGRSFKGVGRV